MNAAKVWSLRILGLAVVSALLVSAFFLGRVSTRRDAVAMPAGTSCEPRRTVSRCGTSKEEVAARNVYWRLWNGGCCGVGPLSSPDELAAMNIAAILLPMVPDDERPEELQRLRNLYFQRYFTDRLNFSDTDVERIEATIAAGTAEQRLRYIRELMAMNGKVSATVQCVLDDAERMKLFFATERTADIPLEALPDGSVP